MSHPAVTVVIPAHNRLSYLTEALDSVAAQSFRDFEVVVVDDGSEEPVAQAAEAHRIRPRVIRQTRQGPAAARNRGIFEARTEWIAFLDSDDMWLPAKLDRYFDAIRVSPGTDIFYGPMIPVDASGRPVVGRTKPRHEGSISQRLFASCFVDVPTVVCRKSLLVEAGGFDAELPVCEDYDLWLRVSVRHSFGYIAEPLARRRLHDKRLSKSNMCRNLAVKSFMLQRFYEAHRGNGVLQEEPSLQRLSRVTFKAGREAWRAGHYAQASELLRTSRAYGRAPLRSLFLSLAAGTMMHLSRSSAQADQRLQAQ